MLTHLLIALLGGGIFLRIAAKEKHRRERYLLLRLAEYEKALAEKEAAEEAAQEQEADKSAPAYEAPSVGQAA